jgi:hypothetical protein
MDGGLISACVPANSSPFLEERNIQGSKMRTPRNRFTALAGFLGGFFFLQKSAV